MVTFNFQNIQKLPSLSGLVNKFLRGSWTLYDSENQNQLITFTSILGYNASENSEVPAHEIEEGSFVAYNKINNPSEFSATLAIAGSNWDLSRALDTLTTYKKSTKLVNLVLPFRTYLNLNIVDFQHAMSEGQAVNMLVVELKLKEIAEVRKQYTSYRAGTVQRGSDADMLNRGRQQAKELKPSLLSTAKNKIKGLF